MSYHDPKLAFPDGRTVARGIGGQDGTRNAPALINRGYGAMFFWDGRAKSLEQQALEPILNPKELELTVPEHTCGSGYGNQTLSHFHEGDAS